MDREAVGTVVDEAEIRSVLLSLLPTSEEWRDRGLPRRTPRSTVASGSTARMSDFLARVRGQGRRKAETRERQAVNTCRPLPSPAAISDRASSRVAAAR
jgi:hypothetical protein